MEEPYDQTGQVDQIDLVHESEVTAKRVQWLRILSDVIIVAVILLLILILLLWWDLGNVRNSQQGSGGRLPAASAEIADGSIGFDQLTPGIAAYLQSAINQNQQNLSVTNANSSNNTSLFVTNNPTVGCVQSVICNSYAVEPSKNFAIQSANPYFAGGIIRGASGQLADMFALENSSGSVMSTFNAAGSLGINTASPQQSLDVYGNGWIHNHAAIGADSTFGTGSIIGPIALGPMNIPIIPEVPIPTTRVLAVQEEFSGLPFAVTPTVYSGTGSEIYIKGDTDAGASGFTGSYSSAQVEVENGYDYPGLSGATSLGVHSGTGNITLGAGEFGAFYNQGSGTVTAGAGVNGTLVNVGSGTITTGFGLGSYMFNTSDGNISNGGGLFVGYGNTGTGTITNLSGVQVLSPLNNGGGTISNVAGIAILDQADTNVLTGPYPTTAFNLFTTGAAANVLSSSTFLNSENSAALTANVTSPYNPTGRWLSNPANTLPTPLKNMGYGYANGYIYLTGGDDGVSSATTSVYYSKIGPEGTLSWSSTTPLPAPRSGHKSFIQNGYIYVVGGEDGVGPFAVSTVYYARINADGSVGTWRTTTGLPGLRAFYGGAQNNGYMYVVAGTDNFSNFSTVYYAKPNSDGTIASWTTSATPLPSAWKASDAVVANGFLYYLDLGGDSVKYASLNADGSNNAWSTASNGPVYGTFNHTAFVNSGNLYRVGGDLVGVPQVITSTAPLQPDGDLGIWKEHESDMATGIEQQAAVVTNGYVFLIGGSTDGSNTVDTVQMSSTRRVGVSGALDLTFNPESSTSLTDGGGATTLTAGNTNIIGALQVYGNSSFRGSLSALDDVNFAANTQLGGDVFFDQELAHTIKINDSTSAATAGAALSILGANGNGAAGGDVVIASGTGTTDGNILLNQTAGYVGVHNSAPGFNLHVGDGSLVSGTTVARFENAGGTCDVTPNVVGAVTCTSDIRVKKNISEITDSLEKIGAIKVYSYNLTAEKDDDPVHVGFLAQELETIMPDLVLTDKNGMKSVSYAGLTPYLVQAIKQQQSQINDLKSQLDSQTTVSVDVLAELAKAKAITINGNLVVNGRVEFSSDNKGKAKVVAGDTKLKVPFASSFVSAPNVVVSPQDFVDGPYRTTAIDKDSFTIELNKAQTGDVEFNWQAY